MSFKKSRLGYWKGKVIRGRGASKQRTVAAQMRSAKKYKTQLKRRRKGLNRASRK